MRITEVLSFLLFISGYMLGRIDSILGIFKRNNSGFFVDRAIEDKKQESVSSRKKFSIDDRKFVTKVSTSSFQKNGELGVNTEVSDNIENETSKLIMLKKKKG